MSQDRSTAPAAEAPVALDAQAYEMSRLLVEFLHAAYASRRLETAPPAGGEAGPLADPHDAAPTGHAIRAAIHLYQHGERTVSQLAAGLAISQGWASRVADELVESGHAVRERDPEDRRVVHLRLTGRSLAEIERAYRWRGDVVARALADQSPAERVAIRRFLRTVIDGLAGEADPHGAGEADPHGAGEADPHG